MLYPLSVVICYSIHVAGFLIVQVNLFSVAHQFLLPVIYFELFESENTVIGNILYCYTEKPRLYITTVCWSA